MNDSYFAVAEIDELGSELVKKVVNYYDYLNVSGLMVIWRNSYNQYFKATKHLGNIISTGEVDEFSALYINHYRSILQSILSITVSQRPTYDARAINNDYESQAQTKLSVGLLDYYMREHRLEKFIVEAAEFAIYLGEGYVIQNWNPLAGKEYGVDENGNTIKNGDIEFSSCSGVDIIRHPYLKKFEDRVWLIHREYVNKYELAAKYPEKYDEIINSSEDKTRIMDDFMDYYKISDQDVIPVYKFYHEDTKAVPGGRYTEFIISGTILFDSQLPYTKIPIHSLFYNGLYGTPFAYSVAFDMLPIQTALDSLNSTIQTNQENFGVQSITTARGSNISISEVVGGMNIIYYDGKFAPPAPLNLLSTPPEIFNQRDSYIQAMETISGVNSVNRGNPESSLKSGSALALVASQSLQALQGYQTRYIQLLEDCGTGIIEILKEYATVPRIATIVGKMNVPFMREFKKDDLSNISRIIVDIGNPLSKTIAGKAQIADTLLQYGMITSPDQYIQAITTGRIDNITDPKQRQMMLIAQENESMQDGISVQALMTDNHSLHVQEHKTLLDSPEARKNPMIVQVVLNHIMEHTDLAATGNPILFGMLNYPPPIAPQEPPNSQGGVQNVKNNQQAEPGNNTKMPSMPKNPLNKQQYQIPSGGQIGG